MVVTVMKPRRSRFENIDDGRHPPHDPDEGDSCEWVPVWNCRHIFFPRTGYQEMICDPGFDWRCDWG